MPKFFSGLYASDRKYLTLVRSNTEDNFTTLSLEKPPAMQIKPGQYINLYSTWLSRSLQKSLPLAIASGVNEDWLEITYKRGHLFSAKGLLERFPVGTKLLIDGPHGQGLDLTQNKNPLLVIGAGSAITLMRSIVRSVKDQEVSLIYSGKKIHEVPYLGEIFDWIQNPNNYFTLTQQSAPYFHTGRINSHLEARAIDDKTMILLCGPDSFLRDIARILIAKGLNKENIFLSLNNSDSDNSIFPLSDEILQKLDFDDPEEEPAKKKVM